MSEVPVLVIVTGPPGVGKTMLSRRLANTANLPLINRDTFKELLFDTLGWSDRAWSNRLGIASYRLLYAMMISLLRVFERLHQRVQSGERHHGHVDHLELADLDPTHLKGSTAPLDNGTFLTRDITDFIKPT